MNFGQVWRTDGVVEVTCVVELPLSWLVEVCERGWDEWVDDAQRFPDDEPMEQRLRELGWPRPDEAMTDAVAAPLVAQYFAIESLTGWLGDGAPRDASGYVLNTVESVGVDDDQVIIKGRARRNDLQGGYAYQDL